MKKILLILLCSITLIISSCDKNVCKECIGCDTLSNLTLCEDDFEKTSNFNDQVENYQSDGCTCTEK